MNIRIAGVQNESIVDGTGLRMTVFFQWCPHHCEGCHNPGTWDPKGGYDIDADEVIRQLIADPLLDGITISGGEPFMQPGAVAKLAHEAHRLGKNVWVYTGYTWENLMAMGYAAYLAEVDVLVDGPFMKDLKSLGLLFRGSENQRILDVQKSLVFGVATLLTT